MTPARIAELLRPFLAASNACHSEPGARRGEEPAVLSPTQLQSISMYIDILLRWNSRINLTAIRNPDEIVTRHFGESLFAARILFPQANHVGTAPGSPTRPPGACWGGGAPGCPAEQSSAVTDCSVADEPQAMQRGRAALQRRVKEPGTSGALAPAVTVADIGSGAGFPGLAIKLWAPQISLTLIESNHKKATFLREVTRALTLTDVNIHAARAETLTAAAFDLVTLRAVEHFEAILPVAANLVAPGGRLALLIGSKQLEQARAALQQLVWSEPAPIPASHSRVLAVAHRPS
jgi:16S rRNA (guanine(527)-N(7))-methyltransferase RsmG